VLVVIVVVVGICLCVRKRGVSFMWM
jgi:hypothetical protein